MKTLEEPKPELGESSDADALIEEARQRQRKRRCLIGIVVLVVAAASGIWAVSGGGSATKPPSLHKKKPPRHTGTPSTPPTTVATIAGVRDIYCGSDFLDASDNAFLTRWFGEAQTCMRAGNSDSWVDAVGGGIHGTTAPGGAVVLVEKCAANDAACLDPKATRSLSEFTAYPAPAPRGRLEFTTFVLKPGTGVGPSCSFNCGVPARGGTLAVILDGACSVDIFDLGTDHWYFGDTKAVYQMAEGRTAGVVEIPTAPSFPADQSPPPTPSPTPAVCHQVVG